MSTNVPKITKHLQTNHSRLLYGCMYIPDFSAQALARNDPKLRKLPLAILDSESTMPTVVATNRTARQAGIEIGMTQLQLESFPGILVRFRSSNQEDSMHRALLDCAHYFSPRVEDTTPGTVTLDLSGLSKIWGAPRAIAQKLFCSAGKLGIEAQVATASNPDTAIHAAMGDAGITVIPAGQEAKQLQQLHLHILTKPESINNTFAHWGLTTFQDLAQLPKIEIAERLGQEGIYLQQLASGKTTRPLLVKQEKLFFEESMELEHSIDSIESLCFFVGRLVHQLCKRLSARNLATNTLTLELLLDSTQKQSARLIRTIDLPNPTRDPELLLKFFQLDLDSHRPYAPVLSITLNAQPALISHKQEGLFRPLAPEPEQLGLTLARIESIVGRENVGTPELLNTYQPDAFRINRFRLAQPFIHKPKPTLTNPPGVADKSATPSMMALRALRPPVTASVKMHQGHPYRIHFSGKSRKIVAAAGPWHSSGQWWRSNSWDREEWDVEVQHHRQNTLYRIHKDNLLNGWFVNGIYD